MNSSVLTEFWFAHYLDLKPFFGSVHSFVHWVDYRKDLLELVELGRKSAFAKIISARKKHLKSKKPKRFLRGLN